MTERERRGAKAERRTTYATSSTRPRSGQARQGCFEGGRRGRREYRRRERQRRRRVGRVARALVGAGLKPAPNGRGAGGHSYASA
jgi:hypothetical protein